MNMGANEMAGLVTSAFVPYTIDEIGRLQEDNDNNNNNGLWSDNYTHRSLSNVNGVTCGRFIVVVSHSVNEANDVDIFYNYHG